MTNKKISNENKNNVSRRKFLQGGAVLGAAIGLSSLTGSKGTEEVAMAFGKKELDEFPHEISPDFKRYDERLDQIISHGGPQMDNPEALALIGPKNPGYTPLDVALLQGAGCTNWEFGGVQGLITGTPLYTWDKQPAEHKYEFASKEDASKAIKRAAKFYGADLVGITPYDEKWVYDPMFSLPGRVFTDAEFPFKPKSVIVMAYEMDYVGMSTAPSIIEAATTTLGYSNMAEVNYKISTFIRALGYNAFGTGNEVAESVPYAIAAGLGEQGRQGLLITYEYGPRIRLNKIFTEMELAYDKPIEFGANKFCQVCKKCAYSCPSQSISYGDEMTWEGETPSKSNHTGVKKYYVNVETCFEYWGKVGNDCGVCLSACPFNKPDFWHHRITTALTATPLKPFLNEMDDLFGYGNVFDEQAARKFWGYDGYAK